MQVVDRSAAATTAGAIPSNVWAGPTARIIERRTRDRRKSARAAPVDEPESQIPTPARNTVIGISLMTFACGLMVATAVHRFRLRAVSAIQPAVLQAASPPAPPSAAIAQPAPQPAASPPVPAPVAVIPPPESEPQPEDRPLVAKAKPTRRAAPAPAARAQKPTPASASRATEPDAFEVTPPPPSPRPARRWVDPFAE